MLHGEYRAWIFAKKNEPYCSAIRIFLCRYTDHHDAVPGTGTRFSSFRRVGATAPGTQPPLHLDIKPFLSAVRKMWPGEKVGPWLGHLSIGTELYDYVVGEVAFSEPPKIAAHPKT